jgi:2'-deoxynucleoside 5'-phosphate N-hydrolase
LAGMIKYSLRLAMRIGMKIYFSCSISGGRQDQPLYQAMVEFLQARGQEVLTAQLASAEVSGPESGLDARAVYERDTRWLRESDVLIAEVSTPSHGVGYEIAMAEGLGKPVLCLHQAGRRVSKMILGNPGARYQTREYREAAEALEQIENFLRNFSGL